MVEFAGSPEPYTGSEEKQPLMADTALLEFSECAHNYIHHYLIMWLTVTDNHACALQTCGPLSFPVVVPGEGRL